MAVKDKHPYSAQNDVLAIASTAREALNQSMGPTLTSIYDTYFDQQREANAELMRKMNPIQLMEGVSFSAYDHMKAISGLKMEALGDLHRLITGSVSISDTVQDFLDLGIPTLWENPMLKDVQEINRWLSNMMMTSYSMPPLMEKVSSSFRASEIAKNISKTITSQLEIPESVIDKLGRKLDFYQVNDLSMAMKVAIADPEIEEAVTNLIDEHPEPIEDLSLKLSLDGTGHWYGAFVTYFGAAITGTNGAALATIVILALLGIVYSEWERHSKDKKESLEEE
ncbi:hypothetical protein ACTXJT_13855 [Corynebacterium casei]|uniref:hypothetical protein n=1 Tax=Corynebacterium casei TaxID=160386 RepID=UPI003FD199CD